MKCPDCGCEVFEEKKVGPHIGKYCAKCGKWIKWIPKKEAHLDIPDDEYNQPKEPNPYDGDYFEDDLPWI